MLFNKKDIKKILIALLAIIGISKLLQGDLVKELLILLYTLPGLMLAISIHESAHAFMAYKLGDETAKKEGRISLNPLKHIDPIGLLSLFIFKIGWGKPVEYNPNYIKVDDIKKAEAKIALAGPVSNFIMALILIFIVGIISKFAPINTFTVAIAQIIYIAFTLNIGLGVFNLIPFPPLDGEKVFYKLYEGEFGRFVKENQLVINIVFLYLIMSGIIGSIIGPIIDQISFGMKNLVKLILG